MDVIVYVKKYDESQELVADKLSFKGSLTLTIETIGPDTTEQKKIKEHILKETERICSEISQA